MYTIRASSWPTIFDCSLRWYYEHVVGLRLPTATPARLGQAVHAGAAEFDRGNPVKHSEEFAIDHFLHPEEDVEPIAQVEADDQAEIAGRMVRQYVNTFGRRNYSHIEVTVSSCVLTTIHGDIEVTGTVDRILDRQVRDIKTGRGRIRKDGSVDMRADYMQLGIYALMARAEAGDRSISGDVSVMAGDTANGRWAEAKAVGAVDLLLGSQEDEGLVEMAAKILHHGAFSPNPKSMLCSPKYCAAYAHKRCMYHG
jgi:hypothetical protein